MAADAMQISPERSLLRRVRSIPGLMPAVLVAVVVLIPWVLVSDVYGRYVLVTYFMNATLAVSYQLLFGYARLVSFGHAALFGLGAYGAGVATQKLGMPPVAGWVLALLGTAIFAAVFGIVVLRLGELFLAVVTLSFGLALVILLQQIAYVGGQDGLVVTPITFGGFDQALSDYYLAGVAFLVVVYVASRLARFRFGRLVHTVGNDPVVAQSTGTNVMVVRVQVFVISAVMAAVAGIVYAHTQQAVSPSVLGLDRSILILAMVVVGGLASIRGALLGAALLTAAPELLASFSDWSTLVYGGLLILVPTLAPRGLSGTGQSIVQRFARVREGR
jgi:branched-chain amino acid transport system permease protein